MRPAGAKGAGGAPRTAEHRADERPPAKSSATHEHTEERDTFARDFPPAAAPVSVDAIDRTSGVVDFRAISQLLPSDSDAKPASWKRIERALREVVAALDDGQIHTIIDRHGVSHTRTKFYSELHRELLRRSLDPKKSEIVARAFDAAFSGTSEAIRGALEAQVADHIYFIGVHNGNARKILLGCAMPVELDGTQKADVERRIELFLGEVSRSASAAFTNRLAGPTAETVVILHSESGGAHQSVARVIEQDLAGRVATVNVNESGINRDDALASTIGIPFNDLYVRLFQQARQEGCYVAAQELSVALHEFISPKLLDNLRERVGSARIVVSTTEWFHEMALVADVEARLLFKLCDWKHVHFRIQKMVDAIEKYDLEGIEIMTPTIDSDPSERDDALFTPREYPVAKVWHVEPSPESKAAARERFELRDDAGLALVMIGSKGVGGISETTVADMIDGYAGALARNELPPRVDLVVFCGSNDALRRRFEHRKKRLVQEAARRHGLSAEQRDVLSERLSLRALGFVKNEDVATLAFMSAAFLTKPGGSTAAELLTAGVQRPILFDEQSHSWEAGNRDVLKRRLGADVVAVGESVYDRVMDRIRAPSPARPTPSREALKVATRVLEAHRALFAPD